MLVIVVAHIGTKAFEARIRDGTGPRSKMIPGIPVFTGETKAAVVGRAEARLSPELIREHGGYRVEDREIPPE